jgi:hypothetical protein
MKVKVTGKDQLWHRIRGAVAGYASGIVRLIGESYGLETLQHAWQEFTLGDSRCFRCDDPHAELFFSWLFHRWSPTRDKGSRVGDCSLYGVTPTRAYLDRNAGLLHPLLRRYLETCLITSPGFYEVANCQPNVGFAARDIMSGVECVVSEELASTSLTNGAIMFAHLVRIGNTTMLEAISPLSFPPETKLRLQRLYVISACQSAALELRALYFALARAEQSRARATLH